MLSLITAVLLIVILLSGIFIACGDWLYCEAVSEGSVHPVPFRIGAGFFLGMALFETLWKLMAYISGNAKITLSAAVLVMISITFKKIKSLLPVLTAYFNSIGIRKIINIVLAIIFIVSVCVFKIFLEIEPFTGEKFSMHFSLGSLHSGRYTNIATFISESNNIPVLNQNYGQAMLASVPLILGFNSPFLALNLWLSFSVIFMCLAFYGFFIMLGLNNLMSLAGAFLMMIGNTALSFFPVLVVDSGSPLFMAGYTDTIFSAGSFLGFLILLKNYYDDQLKSFLYFSIAAAVLCVSWSFSAPQNIVLSAMLVTIVSVIMLCRKRLSGKHKLLYALMVVSALAGITQGGMLTPKLLCDNTQIPGILAVAGDNRADRSTQIRFEFPYHHICNGKWAYGIFYDKRKMYQALETYKDSTGDLREDINYETYYKIETDLFNSMRITFFPLLGLILPWFIAGFRKASSDNELSNIKNIWFASFVLFLLGYLIVFSIQLNGYKWELSRFLVLGYATATISFIASLNIMLKKVPQRKAWPVVLGVMFVMAFGQISFVIYRINKNVFESGNNKVLPFSERFRMLVDLHGIQAE